MSAVGYIQKTGYNKQQGYKYAQEADVVEKVRTELAKRKIFLINSIENTSFRTIKTAKGNELTIATLTVKYTLLDGETGEKLEFMGVGEGMDSGDKAVYKAQTGALKYALMKTFLIPTGDDPERDNDDEDTEPTQPARAENIIKQSRQRPQALATSAQLKKFFAMGRSEKRLTDEQLKKLVKHITGKESSRTLTKQEASGLIELMSEMSGPELLQLIGEKALESAVEDIPEVEVIDPNAPITDEEIKEALR